MFAGRPNVIPPVVGTGVGPHGLQVVHHQQPSAETIARDAAELQRNRQQWLTLHDVLVNNPRHTALAPPPLPAAPAPVILAATPAPLPAPIPDDHDHINFFDDDMDDINNNPPPPPPPAPVAAVVAPLIPGPAAPPVPVPVPVPAPIPAPVPAPAPLTPVQQLLAQQKERIQKTPAKPTIEDSLSTFTQYVDPYLLIIVFLLMIFFNRAHVQNMVAQQNHKSDELDYKKRKQAGKLRKQITARRQILMNEYDREVWTRAQYEEKLAELDEEDRQLKARLGLA